jgi:hypothetical protein
MAREFDDDPLDPIPPSNQAPSCDELLAQLAGQEIDRLVADRSRPQQATESNLPTQPPACQPTMEQALDEVFSQMDLSSSPPVAAAEEPGIDQQTELADLEPVDEDPDPLLSDERRQILAACPLPVEPLRAAAPLRLLQWVNAPLANASDGARHLIGGLAIALLACSAIILTYSLIFGRA